MTKYSNNNPPTSNCFTGILQMFICAGNLPTHPSQHDQILEKPQKSRSFSSNVDDGSVQAHVQAQNSGPGIIARLMGLDSLPNYNKDEENDKITTLDSLFRSKSMNSLHFLPDFDPTRVAFHRRTRTTSASFHEQDRVNYNFVVVRDGDRVDKDTKGEMEAGSKSINEICMCKKNRLDNDGRRVKERKSKKRYEERYYKINSREFRNNVGENSDLLREKLVKKKGKLNGKVVTSKKKVYHKEIMCFEDDQLPSRSPVSVLDDYYKEFEFVTLSKGEGRQTKSNSRRKTSPKIKTNDNLQQEIMPKSRENQQDYCNKIATNHELVKEGVDAADYLVEMLGKICKLAEEEHKKDSNWVTNYELWKMHFMEEVCIHLGQELLDLLLDELVEEIVILSL